MTEKKLDAEKPSSDIQTEPNATNKLDVNSETPVTHAKPKKPCRLTWLVLGLLFGIGGTLAALPLLPLSVAKKLHIPVFTVIQEAPQAAKNTAKVQSDIAIAKSVSALDNKALQSIESSIQSMQTKLDDVSALQTSMTTLSHDLQDLHANQSAVRAAQVSVETMQLHSRLSWVLNPASHLPQMRLAWEEIVLLPSLSTEQHQQAKAMLTLAQQRSDDIYRWQQELDRVLASYHVQAPSTHNFISDWLPHAGALAPVSTWISQQFQLQAAPPTDPATQKIRQEIMAIKQNMSLEKWPDAQAWKALRSRLQLHMLRDDAQHQALTLPEDFSPIQSDIEKLRQTARHWLQESSK